MGGSLDPQQQRAYQDTGVLFPLSAIEAAEAAVADLGQGSVDHGTHLSKVSSVGRGMRSHTGVAAHMFRVLGDEEVNLEMISTSEIKISVLIDRKYMELAVQSLHDAFELDKAG